MKGVTKGTLHGGDLTYPTDDQWIQVGHVRSLYIYPVKSMAGVKVDSFNTDKTGAR